MMQLGETKKHQKTLTLQAMDLIELEDIYGMKSPTPLHDVTEATSLDSCEDDLSRDAVLGFHQFSHDILVGSKLGQAVWGLGLLAVLGITADPRQRIAEKFALYCW